MACGPTTTTVPTPQAAVDCPPSSDCPVRPPRFCFSIPLLSLFKHSAPAAGPALQRFPKLGGQARHRAKTGGLRGAAGSYPHDCDPRAAFDEALVADLLPDLRREWPSYMSLGDSFWAHEWLKHGTCSRPVFNDEHGAQACCDAPPGAVWVGALS